VLDGRGKPEHGGHVGRRRRVSADGRRQHGSGGRATPSDAPHEPSQLHVGDDRTAFTLYSQLYNRLGELCTRASQAALEPSSQDAYDVIRLTRSKAAVWTVDDVARLIEFFFKFLFIYLFLTSIAYDPEG